MEISHLCVSLIHTTHSLFKTRLGIFGKTRDELEDKFIDLLCLLMFLFGLLFSILLLFLTACYGRYAYFTHIFKFSINAKLAWFSQEVPAFGIPVVLLLLDYHKNGSPCFTKLALAGLFLLHYWQRSFVYSLSIKGGKPTPVFIWFLAFLFCIVNGYIQVRSIQLGHFNSKWLTQPMVVLGIILFFIGFAINLQSDSILRNLRKPGETGYKIPRGGMFEYVTAANYFGESIEWFGFLLAVQTLAAAAFSFFTICNLLPRAIRHHRWYREKFEDYPVDRKVIVPYIF